MREELVLARRLVVALEALVQHEAALDAGVLGGARHHSTAGVVLAGAGARARVTALVRAAHDCVARRRRVGVSRVSATACLARG